MAHIYISLGSNINRAHNIVQGLDALAKSFGSIQLSSLFESEAIGFDGAPFYNMVVGIQTNKTVAEVAIELRLIEYANGRKADAKKYSPRTLDLDLLLYDDQILEQPAQIPREEISQNAFVLWPLAELAPEKIHPVLKQSYGQLWKSYNKNSQHLQKVPLSWSPKDT